MLTSIFFSRLSLFSSGWRQTSGRARPFRLDYFSFGRLCRRLRLFVAKGDKLIKPRVELLNGTLGIRAGNTSARRR
jgi:hypothetical protein